MTLAIFVLGELYEVDFQDITGFTNSELAKLTNAHVELAVKQQSAFADMPFSRYQKERVVAGTRAKIRKIYYALRDLQRTTYYCILMLEFPPDERKDEDFRGGLTAHSTRRH